MSSDQSKGIAEQLKGLVNKGLGAVTGNEDRKVEGDVQIMNGANRKDLGDQKENIRKGKTDPGSPTNE
ncbi:CsbD family protein [Paraburkholderia sp. DD10]|uniref:CsbD family protein n=1 Tax=Paraburkholderia sp. DD10 TaxID=3409691 RepID=UPI003B9F7A97